MREILFRGKRQDNGEWVYGDLIQGFRNQKNLAWIWQLSENELEISEHQIIPETIGQYTGLTDKNGNKIFEGDIVKTNEGVYVCRWSDCNYEFEFDNENEDFGIAYAQDVEVIGNIHDNPELLKGGEADD